MLKRKWILALALALAGFSAALGGCQETRADRDYVQADVYEKAVFQGDWFYVRTVVDHDYESSWMGYYGTFVGDQTYSFQNGTLERVAWIIDENYLYAYRVEPIVDYNRESERDTLEDPVAAFAVTKHFDIIKRYNPTTGEELNVIEETENERPWYEREYMRVDWSQNLLLSYYWNSLDAFESLGMVTRQSVPFYCGEGSDQGYEIEGSCDDGLDNDFDGACDVTGCTVTYMEGGEKRTEDLPPDPECADGDDSEIHIAESCKPEWLPAVRYTSQAFDDAYGTHFRKELEQEGAAEGTPYYFSFVTQEMWTPSTEWIWMEVGMGSFPITSVRVSIRNSFMRSPDTSHYEPLMVTDPLWDHFGIIRMEQEVYLGGEGSDDDPENPDDVILEDRGYTDYKNYWGARHNMWVDFEDQDGNTIPVADRELRRIVYYLNQDFPKWLIPSAFEVIEEWNEEFMKAADLARTDSAGDSHDCAVDYGSVTPEHAARFSEYAGLIEGPESTPQFKGGDCVLVLRVNSFDLADGEYADSAGTRTIVRGDNGRIDALRSNVDPNGEQMGDLRFKFFAVIDTPGAAFAGVSLPLMDPRNGELVQANCNVTRESYEGVMTSTLLQLGLASELCKEDSLDFPDSPDCGGSELGCAGETYRNICEYLSGIENIDLEEYMNGEYAREYFANQGRVDLPVAPIVPEGLTGAPHPVGGGQFTSALSRIGMGQFESRMEQLERLRPGAEGRAMLYTDRIERLAGTEWEQKIYDNPESLLLLDWQGMSGPIVDPAAPVTEDMLDKFSLMRKSFSEQRYLHNRRLMSMLDHYMEPHNPFVDYSLVEVAKEFMDNGYDASQIAVRIGQMYYKNVMLHEFGHSIGMEHNFAGSIDQNNYHAEYFKIINLDECMKLPCTPGETSPEREANNCWPCPDNVQFMDFELTVDETYEWSKQVSRMERKREMLGINKYMTSSIMDYLPEVYDDFGGLGTFDKAYPMFAYANKVEAYDGDPKVGRSKFVLSPVKGGEPLEKVYWTHYLGGESCESDSDCPYHAGSGKLPDSQKDQGVTQKCKAHPVSDELTSICSNYFIDAQSAIDKSGATAMDYFPVLYRFCSNNRTYDISWCNMFDQGGSYREVVSNLNDFYQNVYPYSNFRRNKRGYYGGVYWFPFEIMGKINQHLYYRYFYEPEFTGILGPLGFNDMYYSVIDSLNFFSRILSTPDIGSYDFAAEDNSYFKVSDELGQGDLDIPIGMGKYMWSAFQDGQLGVYKLERQGVHIDKLYTLLALVLREWGTSYFYDERFWFNYYDMFPNEALEMIGAYIMDDASYHGARWYTDPETSDEVLMYPQVYSPSICSDYYTNSWADCNPKREGFYFPRPWEQLDGVPTVDGGSNEILRNYALLMSLAELPYFMDTTYEQQMFICEKGSGYCFDLCEAPPEGEGEAAETFYFCNDPDVTPLVPGEDFVTYTSSRLHKTYIAVQVEKLRAPWVAPIDIAMTMLRKADSLQTTYYEYLHHQEEGTCPDGFEAPCEDELEDAILRVSNKLVETESFITNIINIQRQYGISSWLI
ncbi:MAG: hypothetical protein ABIJ56_02100 [Pseudomonadota bacterium]